jgi:hypothetical protein
MASLNLGTHEKCITFAQIIRLFANGGEPDEAALEHIKSCPRCYRMFNQLIIAARVPAAELLPQVEISEEAYRAECLLHDYLYEYLESPETLDEFEALAAGLSQAEKEYLGTCVELLGAGAASPKRAEKARTSLAGAAKAEIVMVYFPLPLRPVIQRIKAAADSDDAKIAATYTLSNKWELTALFRKAEPTRLTLKGAGKPSPALEWAVLPSLDAYQETGKRAMKFSKVSSAFEENGCPVYFLPGDKRHVVGVPTENGVEYLSLGAYDDLR